MSFCEFQILVRELESPIYLGGGQELPYLLQIEFFFFVKMYQYRGDYEPGCVSDFIRLEKMVLFGDFLCGIEPPCLAYNMEAGIYESVMERESGEEIRGDNNKEPARLSRPSVDSDDAIATAAPQSVSYTFNSTYRLQ